jgi:SAM-dependent methyltransferase
MSWSYKRVEDYEKLDWVNDKSNLCALIMMCNARSHDTIVDFGTGTGIVASALAPYCKKVIGVDISPLMISKAPKMGNVEYRVLDGEKSPLPECDCVVARMSLHHLEYPDAFIYSCKAPRLVVCEGIPPPGCAEWYEEMFSLKEERKVITPDWLIKTMLDGDFCDVDMRIDTTLASINNWLGASGLPKERQRQIFNMHVDAPPYVKSAYDMQFVDGDIHMKWQTAIVKGFR